MKNSMKLALCGVMAALSTVLLFLTGAAPVATLALPAIAGCLLIPVVVEVGLPWAFGVYGVCSVLGVFLAPDRQALLFYVLFFGHYPALFAVLGRIRAKALRYVAKLLVFNAAMALEVLLSVYLLGIPFESFAILGPLGPVLLAVLANVVFIVFDRALEGLIVQYLHRLHPPDGQNPAGQIKHTGRRWPAFFAPWDMHILKTILQKWGGCSRKIRFSLAFCRGKP